MMRRPRTLPILALTAALALGACGDDEGPTTPENSEEFQAVVNALNSSGALGFVGIYAAFVDPGAITFGEISVSEGSPAGAMAQAMAEAQATYQAMAIEVNVSIVDPEEGPIEEGWTAIAAWVGLDVDAETVDEAITAFALNSALADNSANIATEEALAYVVDHTTGAGGTVFLGSTGTFNVSSKNFGATTPYNATGLPYEITYGVGTISGSFDFVASDFSQEPVTVTRSASFPALPAIQINITGGSG